ncbi:MAG: PAS domain-containing hybrid sensor histidine kinase/response regulator [Alphaproteobacteria bacterium]
MTLAHNTNDDDLLRLLADSLPGLACYIDHQRRFRFVNARFRDGMSIEPADCLGRSLEAILGADVHARLEPYLVRVFAGEDVTFENERILGGDRAAHMRTHMVPHKAHDGTVLGMFVFTIDVTREWQASELHRIARDQAEASRSGMSELLAAASHDLRQPLHAMTLFARALSRRVETDEAKDLVRHMETALGSLRDMINTLLDMSKLDAGLIEPHVETVALPALLEPLRAGFTAVAREQGLRFRLRTLDLAVRADPALLETMLRNLIANALKFTAKGGVLVGCRRRGTRLCIEVCDTGPGIPEDRLELVFDSYRRSAAKAGGANEGLGLGLAIVRRLADLVGAELSIRSVVGRGSRFTIELPIAPSKLGGSPAAVGMGEDRRSLLSGRTILVLDDDREDRLALAQELADHGSAVVTASSGKELMSRLPELRTVDAAIVDYELPDGTGPKCLTALNRCLGVELPAIVITGTTSLSMLDMLNDGGWRWLVKPVDPELLLSALQALHLTMTVT